MKSRPFVILIFAAISTFGEIVPGVQISLNNVAIQKVTATQGVTRVRQIFEGQRLKALFNLCGKPDDADVVQVYAGTNLLLSASSKKSDGEKWHLFTPDGHNADDFTIPVHSTIRYFHASEKPITLNFAGMIPWDDMESLEKKAIGNNNTQSRP